MPFSFHISAKSLVEPIGGVFRFVAKLDYFYRATATGEVAINLGLGESYGTTEAEAKAKLRDRVNEWIGQNGESTT